MGVLSWFQDCGVMMMRTKPQYLSVLGRKRSSIRSPNKPDVNKGKDCGVKLNYSICLVIMFCSVSYGVVLLLLEGVTFTASTLIIPLIIAGICSVLGGISLAEYISEQAQEVPSIYTCCYQYSSEILAFFIGWTWLFSQAAMVAAICKVLVLFVSQWSGNSLLRIMEKTFSVYADAVPCALIVLLFSLFVLTGLGLTLAWYAVFITITFILIVTAAILTRISSNGEPFSFEGSWLEVNNADQILTSSAMCLLFFTGPQSILRINQKHIRQRTSVTLGLLNVVGFFLILLLLTTVSRTGKLLDLQVPPKNPTSLAINIILVICLSILTVESFHPLHFVIEDMASDGLLFRTFSKKWKPFCLHVASPVVQLLTMTAIIVLAVFLELKVLLILSVLFPLVVHTLIPLLVLDRRYKDNTSWQYEPMFQTTAKNVRDRSRKKSEESQYTNGIGFDNYDRINTSNTCIDEETSDTSEDNDIDSMVQQYKDQAMIANMPLLEEHSPSDQIPEPTPATAFRAKLCIIVLFLTSLVNALILNLADLQEYLIFGVIILICLLFSTVVQGMLLYLPQNKNLNPSCCPKLPSLPWAPGMASLIATSLLLHCLFIEWKFYLGWIIMGTLVYFSYGVRSSTAANSFYNLRPSHVALHPLPSYRNNCVAQVVPSQRKLLKQKSQTNIKRKILM